MTNEGGAVMNKEISTGTLAAIVVVVVLVLGLVAWRMFGSSGASSQTKQDVQNQIQQDYKQRMQGGQGPAGVPPGPR
jgi:hypothetical protein